MERMEPATETPREAGAEERRLICPWCDSDEVEKSPSTAPT